MARKFKWKRQLPDMRDKHFLSLKGIFKYLPDEVGDSVDMRGQCPDVYDQGQLGSCTANAIAFACEFDWMKEKKDSPFVPSRLFIYYNERDMEGTVDSDAGAQIRDGIKSLDTYGFAPESLWPYDESAFANKPSADTYSAALKEQVKDYGSVNQDMADMKLILSAGYPIVLGISVYDSFMSEDVASTGMVPMPSDDENMQGGHAIACVGYNESGWIMRNSWGSSWGQNGYFILPYDYLLDPNLASDFWVVRMVP